jgi:predicted membrane-bound spermidine synthase
LGNHLLFVFSITLFVNAALLFIIEPMIAKMILPSLGGSPAVWNTSLVFYQACLLAGYAYAHFGSSWIGTKRHALLHLNFVLAAVLLLPIAVPLDWFATPSENPAELVLAVLCVSIGIPFLVVSAGAPLLQKWFAQCDHKSARDPYFLYAASNCGSMVGLLAYPLLLEPNLTLSQQNHLWFYGYLTLLILTAACVLLCLRPLSSKVEKPALQLADCDRAIALHANNDGEIQITRRLRWLVWSFVPSSLLSGVTTYVTTDVVAAPLFWVAPLAAYLLSFVFAFSLRRWTSSSFVVRRQAFLLLGAALTVATHATSPVYVVLPLHLLAFFATALVCHGRLAEDRPAAKYLTGFYLWISLGGVLGGLFNALLAPLIFNGIIEYPLAMVAAAFVRPYVGVKKSSRVSAKLDWLLPVLLVAGMFGLSLVGKNIAGLANANLRLAMFGIGGVICLGFAYRPVRFGGGLVALLLIAWFFPPPFGKVLYKDRSFFGTYRATYDLNNKRHLLFQGTTIHGAQSSDEKMRLQPLSYYHRTSPVGQVLLANGQARTAAEVAIVGLGTGALACHGDKSQKFTFYEIDPLVEKIARDDRLFTYLRDCPPRIQVVIGDARISLAKAPNQHYDLFILDAFSSDVIPMHLLTREAMELYLSKTAPDGVLLFHISNRYMDLAPVLDRLAKELGLMAVIQNDFNLTEEDRSEGKSSSRWILFTRSRLAAGRFISDSRWRILDGRLGGDLWTDQFSDILKVLYWR